METCPACTADAKSLGARIATLCSSVQAAQKSALGLAIARERRQRADVPLRRDVNDNRSPKKKMRLDVH
jgi:hypothetical protein